MYDIIVIGGGPAGMTAALYGLRAGKSVLIIEKESFGGQMTFSPKIENYPGFLSISGNELASQMMDQVTEQGAELAYEEAISLDVSGKLKKVITDGGGEYEARAVIIASGVKHRLLNVPGEEKFLGEGISFCAVCDLELFTRQGCSRGRRRQFRFAGGSAAFQHMLKCYGCTKS